MTSENGNRVRSLRHGRFLTSLLVIAVFSTVVSYGAAQGISDFQANSVTEALQISGIKTMNASDLESLVTKRKLKAYWVGPQAGFAYLLNATIPGEVSIKYVPIVPSGVLGRTTRTSLRQIHTYEQENAFAIVNAQASGGTRQNFINADGNSVHLDSAVPGLIYVGMKEEPIQVVMFDPDPTRNLALASMKGGLFQIGKF